jgi:uncharacterized protein (TIGR00251 family)
MLNRDFKITKAEEGAAFAVHIVPKCKKNEVIGKYGDALKVHLTSASVKESCNETLLNFLAKKLRVNQKNVEIVAGTATTEKMVVVMGLTPIEAERRLLS